MKLLTKEQIETLDAEGYLFIRHLEPDLSTYDIASTIGNINGIQDISSVQELQPKEKSESTSNLYSGNYGLEEFPLHSDLAHWFNPPRFLMLRCKIPSNDVFTFLFDVQNIIKDIEILTIKRALFKPRKKISGHQCLLRFYETNSGIEKYRWDKLFIIPDNKEALTIAKYLSNITSKNAELKFYYTEPGDTIIVDNWRMFHGRSNVPQLGKNRTIERVYLSEIST